MTHRTVAREAKVPLAATTYYFASKDEILAEALESLSAVEVERLSDLAAEIGTGSKSQEEVAAALGKALIPEPEDAERAVASAVRDLRGGGAQSRASTRGPALAGGVRRPRGVVAESGRRARPRAPRADRDRGDQRHPPRPLRGVGDDPQLTMATRFNDLFALLLSA